MIIITHCSQTAAGLTPCDRTVHKLEQNISRLYGSTLGEKEAADVESLCKQTQTF